MPASKKTINPDLDKERRKCTFNVEELARYWYGDQTKLDEKRARGMLLCSISRVTIAIIRFCDEFRVVAPFGHASS